MNYNPFESLENRLSNIENLLLDLKHAPRVNNEAATPANDLMTVHEAAAFLHLAVPSIYSMISRGTLPYMKRSKRVYFSRTELTEFLKAGHRSTAAEVVNADHLVPIKKRS